MSQDNHVYEARTGWDVPLKPFSATKIIRAEMGVEQDFRDAGEPIDTPTYDVPTAGGGVQTYDLAEDAIKIPDDPEETARRQEAWDAHQDALKRLNAAQFDVTKKIVLRSIDLELPEDDAWVKEQEELHIRIPEEPLERWMHWIDTEVLLPQDVIDMIALILDISATGLVPREDVEAAKRKFRGPLLERSERSGDEEDPAGGHATEEGSVGAQPVDDHVDGSEGMGQES